MKYQTSAFVAETNEFGHETIGLIVTAEGHPVAVVPAIYVVDPADPNDVTEAQNVVRNLGERYARRHHDFWKSRNFALASADVRWRFDFSLED